MTPPLHEWETFYVIVGSSAAALTGLQFVVLAIISDMRAVRDDEALKAFGTPTVVHFSAVLLIAAFIATPRQTSATLSACLTISAVIALGYIIRTTIRARRQTGYQPVFEDWLWHTILPFVAYASLLVAGIVVLGSPVAGLYVVAVAALLLLYIGIHNAWDTAVYISTTRPNRDGEAQSSQAQRTMALKDTATDFLHMTATGNVREAYRKYTGPKFRHHNPYFKGDAESLMLAQEENAKQHPDKTLEVKHALQDGDLVTVHSHVRMKPGDRGVGVVHIFRFEGDRVAELWDLGQPVPENSPNENGMF